MIQVMEGTLLFCVGVEGVFRFYVR